MKPGGPFDVVVTFIQTAIASRTRFLSENRRLDQAIRPCTCESPQLDLYPAQRVAPLIGILVANHDPVDSAFSSEAMAIRFWRVVTISSYNCAEPLPNRLNWLFARERKLAGE